MSCLSSLVLALVAFQHLIIDTQASEEDGTLTIGIIKVNLGKNGLRPFPRVGRSEKDVPPFSAPLNSDSTPASDTDNVKRSIMRVNRDSSGLIPFPRIGRSRSPLFAPLLFDNSHLLHLDPLVESEETPWNMISALQLLKRGGLIPFPRVGRSGTGPKRNGAGTSGALWFGPRLGKRVYPDNTGADTNPTDNVPDYFNQNKMAFEDTAASLKAEELND